MKILNTILVVGILVWVGGLYFMDTEPRIGSVAPMGGYNYSHYDSVTASNTAIFAGGGIFGSVIVTEDPAVAIVFYDSATTTADGLASSTHSTEIATMEAAQAEGVYTFDANVTKGLVMSVVSAAALAGDITITHRQGY